MSAEKRTVSEAVRFWKNEISAARKREKEYIKEGQRVRAIYSGEKRGRVPFNILYSNTETLLPALFGTTPKPVVQRRFKDADPNGKAAAMAGQRCLEFLLDTNLEEYETFDATMRDVTLDALLPGRGLSRVKYEADIVDVPQDDDEAEGDTDDSPDGNDQDDAPTGSPELAQEAQSSPAKAYETVCTETVPWDRVYFGYAKKWSKVPWVAFEHHMDRPEAEKMFGVRVAAQMVFTPGDEDTNGDDWDGERKKEREDQKSERKTCLVYEIWHKKARKVRFVSPTYPEGYLKEEDDPLDLTGFYPVPKPMRFLAKTEDLSATALYTLYENQATELNKISIRINRIVEAIKVRGAYDGSLGDTLNDLLKQDDNSMIAAENASSIRLEGGLDKYIWFMPLEQLVAVLQQLYQARNECKQIIYEVTGLSDIIRGASVASETATAQNIKNQWGSLRIKMLQNEVRRYVRDTLRLMLEVAAKQFSVETFAQMTGLPYVTAEQKAQAQALIQAAQIAGQPLDPQTQAQIGQVMAAPDWDSVLALLKNDLSRAYRIDIETNSTVEVNEQEDKQNIAEAMGAMGQFVNGITPLVEQGIMPFAAAQSMLLAIVRRFRFGTEVEEEIKAMQPPQPKPDPKIEEKQAELLADKEKAAMQAQNERAVAQERAQLEREKAEADRLAANDRLAADRAIEQIKAQAQAEMRRDELASEERIARERMVMERDLALEKAAMEVAGKVMAETMKAHEKAEPPQQEAAEGAQHEANEVNPAIIMQQIVGMQGELLAAIRATKKRTPVRNEVGEILHVLEEPA